jgi:septum formation protein
MQLILASTSRYRRELLERLRVPFAVVAPETDESPLPGESPRAIALRLSLAKAQAVAALHPQAYVIGSDQVADLNGQAIGKPITHSAATLQLQRMSGETLVFHSGVALVAPGFEQVLCVPIHVTFRHLSADTIEHYLRAEQPYDCAGSAKSEGLGIALTSRIESDDPTALIGLPLITVCSLLESAGFNLFSTARS